MLSGGELEEGEEGRVERNSLAWCFPCNHRRVTLPRPSLLPFCGCLNTGFLPRAGWLLPILNVPYKASLNSSSCVKHGHVAKPSMVTPNCTLPLLDESRQVERRLEISTDQYRTPDFGIVLKIMQFNDRPSHGGVASS